MDVAFSNDSVQTGTFSYSGGTWSTMVGGGSVTHSENRVLTIIEQSGFLPNIPGPYAGHVYQFTAVPAPAGIWLLGTALGALGLIRSRTKA